MKAENLAGEEWSPAIPARYIAQVKQKLAEGIYRQESVRCFCGADFNDTKITDFDRYQMPYRLVMCNECCLMRATPRMSKEAYHQFYNIEYRKIYDGWEFGAKSEDEDFCFMAQMESGISFKAFTKYFNINPKTVIDLGCNMGGMLLPFRDDGAKIYGAEICNAAINYGRKHDIPIFAGGIRELAEFGIKGDLVVMQDVIEHLTDLDDLEQIHRF